MLALFIFGISLVGMTLFLTLFFSNFILGIQIANKFFALPFMIYMALRNYWEISLLFWMPHFPIYYIMDYYLNHLLMKGSTKEFPYFTAAWICLIMSGIVFFILYWVIEEYVHKDKLARYFTRLFQRRDQIPRTSSATDI